MSRTRRLSVLVAMTVAMTLFIATPAHASSGRNGLGPLACLNGRWTTYVTTTGASFPNVWACVFYALRGGALMRAQTISITSANPSPVTVGGTYTPTATATSGLPVAITVDPTSSSVCSQSGSVVTFLATGTCKINANQAGNATYNPAARVQQSVNVVRRTQSISFTSPNPSPVTVGGTYTPTATATSGLPVTLTVDPTSSTVCSQSGAVVSFNAVGTCTIDADQAGDANTDPAPRVQQSVTVQALVNTGPSVCQSVGGTFTLRSTTWRCDGVPDPGGTQAFRAPLDARCLADGGVGLGGVPNYAGPVPDGTWNTVCLADALDVLLFVTSTAVQAALVAAFYPGAP